MNLIFVCLDSFRQDHVGFYHQGRRAFRDVPACRTPNLDAFARECVVFDRLHPCGLPSFPVRTEILTGQFTLPFRPWQALNSSDLTLPEILRAEGYVSALITDLYHYFVPGMNLHRGFHVYRWIRGQEFDAYASHNTCRNLRDYINDNYPPHWQNLVCRFLANTDDMKDERQWFCARLVDQACDWLKKNRSDKRRKFLWLDSLDPHEPWDPPPRFDVYTDPDYRGPRLVLPLGGAAKEWASPEEVRHIRGLYAGEAAYVDHYVGELLACLKELGYYEDSVIVILSDHGHPLADHGKFLKGTDRLYSELLNVLFFVHFPGCQPRLTHALAQMPDILPTLLELLGFTTDAQAMAGRSLVPVLRGEKDTHRDAVIVGYYEGFDRCIRDENWSYIRRPNTEPDELYNLAEDPRETRNLIDEYPDQARRLAARFGSIWYRHPPQAIKGVQGRYELAGS